MFYYNQSSSYLNQFQIHNCIWHNVIKIKDLSTRSIMPIDLWISIFILGNAQQFVKSEVCFLLWSVLPEILFTSEIKYFQTHEANGLLSNFQSCQQYSTIRRSVGRPVWKNFGCERFPIVLFLCVPALYFFSKKSFQPRFWPLKAKTWSPLIP